MSARRIGGSLQLALAAYADALVAGARVAVLGEASSTLGLQLVEQGARSVRMWDPDADHARAEAKRALPPAVTVHPYAHASATDPLVDLALITDLGAFGDPREVLERARRMVGESGTVVLTAKNKEAPTAGDDLSFDYYELYDLVAREFASVTMVGQWAFRGTTFAAFGEPIDDGVNVDMQLAGDRNVERFVVFAGQRQVAIDPYVLVELPAEVPDAQARGELAIEIEAIEIEDAWKVQAARTAELESALAESSRRANELAAEVATLRAAVQAGLEATADVTEMRAAVETGREAVAEVATLLAAVQTGRQTSAQLEKTVQTALAAEAAADKRALAAAAAEKRALAAEAAADKRALATEAALEKRILAAEAAEKRADAIERDLAATGAAQAMDVARLEESLRERAYAIRSLEADLANRERIVRDLLDLAAERPTEAEPQQAEPQDISVRSTNGDSLPADEAPGLRERLDSLALELARRQAQAQATEWALAEAELRLRQMSESAPR